MKHLPHPAMAPVLAAMVFFLAPAAPANDPGAAATPAQAEPDAGRAGMEQARVLLAKAKRSEDDLRQAYDLMRAAADAGNPDAIGGLGYFHALGLTVPQDAAQAARCYQSGAEKGSAKSMLNLSRALRKGDGIAADVVAANQWLERAAAAHQVDACLELGLALFHGDAGLPKDHRRAIGYLGEAAGADIADAQHALGFLLLNGVDVPKDEATAIHWLRRAAMQGHPKAQSLLGRTLGPADIRDADHQIEAVAWLLLASDQREMTAVKSIVEVQPSLDEAFLRKAEAKRDALRAAIQRAMFSK